MTQKSRPSQDKFLACYRGGQSRLHHMAYLRMCKVFVILEALHRAGCNLERKRIFDYAFGAGTFFRFCPASAHLSGVELDDQTVAEVTQSLADSGRRQCDLRAIRIEDWREHALLKEKYDVIVCSHVLEHLDDPAALLAALGSCLSGGGILVALVPANEIRPNPHHVQVVDQGKMAAWGKAAGVDMRDYFECDHIGWAIQPIFAADSGPVHKLARAVSLGLGVPLSLGGLATWRLLDRALAWGKIPRAQACAVFAKSTPPSR